MYVLHVESCACLCSKQEKEIPIVRCRRKNPMDVAKEYILSRTDQAGLRQLYIDDFIGMIIVSTLFKYVG